MSPRSDRVFAPFAKATASAWRGCTDACGVCDYCITGWQTLCAKQRNSGYSVNGGFTEYVISSAACVARIPTNSDAVAMAPILCAGVTTYKGITEADVNAGEWIAISGIGALGHLAIQYAKAMGLHVAAVDIDDSKLTLARALGADIVVDASYATRPPRS